MYTQPADLPNHRIAAAVRDGWGIDADNVTHAAVGFGSHHWVVESAGRRWFVTVDSVEAGPCADDGPPRRVRLGAALATARLLRDLGLHFVVAPVPTSTGDLLIPVGGSYVAALYPYIEGAALDWGPYPDAASRTAVLDHLIALHTAPRRARHAVLADDLSIPCRDRFDEAASATAAPWTGGPFAEAARRLLYDRSEVVARALARYDRLASAAMSGIDRYVVTHGEPHRGNTIVTDDGVVLIDWDTVLLAPPERDLWWLAREDRDLIGRYVDRTGVMIDPDALDLHRRRWDLTDITLFTVHLYGQHEDDEDSRTVWDAYADALARLDS